MPEYNYNEDKLLEDVKQYIDSTYGQHYVAKDIQVVDVWESLGTLETTARDTAIKYLCRYGKKEGRNKKDLLKAIHYIILMMYAGQEQSEDIEICLGDYEFGSDSTDLSVGNITLNLDIQDAYDKVNDYDSYFGK